MCSGMPLAEWKQYDNQQLARYERIRQADQSFDAEVDASPGSRLYENGATSPFIHTLLGWQYTPLIASAVAVLATDAAYVLLLLSPQPMGWVTLAGALGLWMIGRAATILSVSATGYQYKKHLYCTTQQDVIISTALFGIGFIPKPDLSIANHIALLYTAYTTWIRDCPTQEE